MTKYYRSLSQTMGEDALSVLDAASKDESKYPIDDKMEEKQKAKFQLSTDEIATITKELALKKSKARFARIKEKTAHGDYSEKWSESEPYSVDDALEQQASQEEYKQKMKEWQAKNKSSADKGLFDLEARNQKNEQSSFLKASEEARVTNYQSRADTYPHVTGGSPNAPANIPPPPPPPPPPQMVAYNHQAAQTRQSGISSSTGFKGFGGIMERHKDYMEIIDDTSGYDTVDDSTIDVDPNTGCRYSRVKKGSRLPYSRVRANVASGEIDPVTGNRTMIAEFIPDKNGESVFKVADVQYYPDMTVAREEEVTFPQAMNHINEYYGRMITDVPMGEAGNADIDLRRAIIEAQEFSQNAYTDIAPAASKIQDKFKTLDMSTAVLILGVGYIAVKSLPSKYLALAAGLLYLNAKSKN